MWALLALFLFHKCSNKFWKNVSKLQWMNHSRLALLAINFWATLTLIGLSFIISIVIVLSPSTHSCQFAVLDSNIETFNMPVFFHCCCVHCLINPCSSVLSGTGSGSMPTILHLKKENLTPCKPLVMWSPSILSVGQCSICTVPRSTWSVVIKCLMFKAPVVGDVTFYIYTD